MASSDHTANFISLSAVNSASSSLSPPDIVGIDRVSDLGNVLPAFVLLNDFDAFFLQDGVLVTDWGLRLGVADARVAVIVCVSSHTAGHSEGVAFRVGQRRAKALRILSINGNGHRPSG